MSTPRERIDVMLANATPVHANGRTGDAPSNSGAAILGDLYQFLRRFVAYPSSQAQLAHALWIMHTHLMDLWESTPRIAFLSPEPGSGKTRALEVSELLVPRPVEAVNATPAYLFRKVSQPDGLPTVLFDEIDTVFGARAKEHEELRGILNAGHRRGSTAGRCVVRGTAVMTEELPAYCAVAMAGLGNLPDTILTRSVVIRMRRRSPTEKVEPFRRRMHAPEGHALRDRIALWCEQNAGTITRAWPEMPSGIVDRDADVWEALIAVANAVGGEWAGRAAAAAVTLVAAAREHVPSLGVRLLSDLRIVFEERDVMHTDTVLAALMQLEESPWVDLRGKALDARKLAAYLRPYGTQPKLARIGEVVARGYRRDDMRDAWTRYLTAQAPGGVTSVTPRPDDMQTRGEPDAAKTEPLNPQAIAPADVTPVTDVTRVLAGGPVKCVDCGWLDPPDTCGNYERNVDADADRRCTGFIRKVST